MVRQILVNRVCVRFARMRLMQSLRKSEHSFDGSVFLLILNELGHSSEPASYIPCRSNFILCLIDFTGPLTRRWTMGRYSDSCQAGCWLAQRLLCSWLPVCVWLFCQALSTVQCRPTPCTAWMRILRQALVLPVCGHWSFICCTTHYLLCLVCWRWLSVECARTHCSQLNIWRKWTWPTWLSLVWDV